MKAMSPARIREILATYEGKKDNQSRVITSLCWSLLQEKAKNAEHLKQNNEFRKFQIPKKRPYHWIDK